MKACPPTGGALLPGAARPWAVAIVVACVLVIAVQAVWIRHGMETSRVDTAIDARLRTGLGGHPRLLAVLVWPGAPVPSTAMAAALALVCIVRRRYRQAALVAVSVPLAAALTELVLKAVIGRTSWGNPFPSGHVTSVAALATALAVLLAGAPAGVPHALRRVVACAAFLVTAAVAVGVVGAGMHHFADSVGGVAVGAGTALLTALFLDLLGGRHRAAAVASGPPGPAEPGPPAAGAPGTPSG